MPQNIPSRGHRDRELGKSDLTNFRNFVKLLGHRYEGGNRNLENHVHNAP